MEIQKRREYRLSNEMRTKLEDKVLFDRESIYSKLGKNMTAKYVEKLFTVRSEFVAQHHDATNFLTDLDIPFKSFYTFNEAPALYSQQFIFYFAPTKLLEDKLVLMNIEELLKKIDILGHTEFYSEIQSLHETLVTKTMSRQTALKSFKSIPTLTFIYEHLRGAINNPDNYNFTGVFNAKIDWLVREAH